MTRTPKQEAHYWLDELRDLSPEVRYLIWRDASEGSFRPKPDQFATLIVDDEELGHLRCPHCGASLYYHDLYVAHAAGPVFNEPQEIRKVRDVQTLEIYPTDIEDSEEFVAVECQHCDQPVSLPAGWAVDTDG